MSLGITRLSIAASSADIADIKREIQLKRLMCFMSKLQLAQWSLYLLLEDLCRFSSVPDFFLQVNSICIVAQSPATVQPAIITISFLFVLLSFSCAALGVSWCQSVLCVVTSFVFVFLFATVFCKMFIVFYRCCCCCFVTFCKLFSILLSLFCGCHFVCKFFCYFSISAEVFQSWFLISNHSAF